MNFKLLPVFIVLINLFACSNQPSDVRQNANTNNLLSVSDTLNNIKDIFESDTAIISNKRFVWTIYRNDSSCYFIVKQETNGHFVTIMKDPEFTTNNSGLAFFDINNDGYLDILEGNQYSYLFNSKTENFSEVGEFHSIDTLKINSTPILYENKYPLLYYLSYGRAMAMGKCSDDTMINENHSELFVINENFQKISFATLDNFATFDGKFRDSLDCGAEIINCYVPPYYGKYDKYSVWNNGKTVDSFLLTNDTSFYHEDFNAVDSDYITNYWLKNYSRLLQYGQVFKVRREKPIEYFE